MKKAIRRTLESPEIILRKKLKNKEIEIHKINDKKDTEIKTLRFEKETEICKLRVEKDSEITILKSQNESLLHEIEEYKLKDTYVRSLIHELKNINRDLKYDTDDLNFDAMSADELNIWSQSNLLSIVMNTYGFQYNQEKDNKTFKWPIPIYKKVDKLRRCYSYRRNSNFTVVISGSSIMGFPATEIIEVLFYILIENASKYSLKNEKLYVNFKENGTTIKVIFSNKCELPCKEEIPKLTEMNYRGQNQTKDGKGIGLATFASICKSLGIQYNITTQENGMSLNRKPIGFFKVELTFYDCVNIK